MNKGDKLLRIARGKKSESSWNEYKRQLNKCTSLVRNAPKSKYFRNMLDETLLFLNHRSEDEIGKLYLAIL